MPRRCITSSRFTMVCDIIKPSGAPAPDYNPATNVGGWQYQQDPDSGAIIKSWVDDTRTPGVDESTLVGEIIRDVPLMARGVMTQGIYGAGSTERFSEIYTNVDWVKATFAPGTRITKRDRITNIRSKRNGEILWKEEEITGYPPTTFNVMGITPTFDPFSRPVELSVLLERAEVQVGVQ